MKRLYLLAAIALIFLCVGQVGAVIMNSSFPSLYITWNGTTIVDSSLNAATITKYGNVTNVPAKFYNGASFDGISGSYISIPNNSVFEITYGIPSSVSFWYNYRTQFTII